MLLSLHVKNFAIIDETEVFFDDNLNILTGETGAGKSILLGAVNMALGAKISRDVIGNNAEYALAELIFVTGSEKVRECMVRLELPFEGDEIIISRKLLANGRSVVRINGESTTVNNVREIAGLLLDIHGQHEHQSLLNKSKHLEILDEFAGKEAYDLRSQIAEEYSEYKLIRDELSEVSLDESKRKREMALLEHEISEIEAASLKTDEESRLKAEYKRLINSHAISEGLNTVYQIVSGDDGLSDLSGRAIKALSRISEYDSDIDSFLEQTNEIEGNIYDLSHSIASFLNNLEDSSERLSEVEDRLDIINRLKDKYGNTVEDILEYAENSKRRLDKLADYEQYKRKLEDKLTKSEAKLRKSCELLTACRRANAARLAESISTALEELNFNQVRFDIFIEEKPGYYADGRDTAEFMIALNTGEALKPLTRIASGGEMSRIMLAIKSVLAKRDEIETLIFDEIDSGISGRTAQRVSEKLALIAGAHQVICITHLPQIAAMADRHFCIEKKVENGLTRTYIRRIDESGITDELSRLIGGTEITDSIMAGAGEMKRLADNKKKELRDSGLL